MHYRRSRLSGPIGEDLVRFQRKTEPQGLLAVFGYGCFEDQAKAAGVAVPKLMNDEGWWRAGVPYKVLDFADGKRNAQEIRDAGSAEDGPVPANWCWSILRRSKRLES